MQASIKGYILNLQTAGIYFNTSILEISPDMYLYAIRYDAHQNKNTIIPGICNLPTNNVIISRDLELNIDLIEYLMQNEKVKRGINFWWGDWEKSFKYLTTIFVIGDHKSKKYQICELEGDIIFKNFLGNDDRLIKKGNHIYLHSSSCNLIFELHINVNEYVIKYEMLSSRNFLGRNFKGANLGIVFFDENTIILDGFYEGVFKYHIYINQHIQTKQIYYKYPFSCDDHHAHCIPKNKHICGSNRNDPIFSLGPSKLITINGKRYILCVGHLKLCFHFDQLNENIKTFIDHLEIKNEKLYGSTYVPHYRYIYMLCFYLFELDIDGNIIRIFISKAILPLFDKFGLNYNFSLFFPTGLEIKESEVIISGGYGDYYGMILQFYLMDVVNMCNCDMHNFDIDKYEFCLCDVSI